MLALLHVIYIRPAHRKMHQMMTTTMIGAGIPQVMPWLKVKSATIVAFLWGPCTHRLASDSKTRSGFRY
jgi:hypothetical protein